MQQTPGVIQLQERQPKERIVPPPKVSASSLFRFFKKADYLFESLENAAFMRVSVLHIRLSSIVFLYSSPPSSSGCIIP